MPGGLDVWGKGQFWYLLGFLLIVVLAAIPRLRSVGFAKTARMALLWILIFGGLAALIVEWPRLHAALDPAAPVSSARDVRVQARQDGHFYVRARVGDQGVLFMVDTGATDIVLTRATAERLGLSPDSLHYDRAAMTADGPVRIANVRLPRLNVGAIQMEDVPASVSSGGLDIDLLGMRFLNALDGWRVEDGILILSRAPRV